MEKSDHQIRLSIIQAWATWIEKVEERKHRGGIWYAADITLLFDHIPGNFRRKWAVMADEADRVYSTLIRHVVHNPRSPSQAAKLPIWIVAPDYQVKKHGMSAKAILAEVKINDGLHLNGIMLMRIDTRLRVTLSMHLTQKANITRSMYTMVIRSGEFTWNRLERRRMSWPTTH